MDRENTVNTVYVFGNEMKLDSSPVSTRLRKNGIYEEAETHILLKNIKGSSVFLDIGAHIGYYSLLASTKIKSGTIHAFEPYADSFKLLIENINLNKIENIRAIQAAAFSHDTKMDLFINEKNLGDNSLYENGDGLKFPVHCLKLDNLFSESKIDFIKIDTQGAEIEVLDGLAETISKNKIKMLIEFYPTGLKKMGHEPGELLEEITRMGFLIYNVRNMKKLKVGMFPQFLEHMQRKSHINLFCVKGG